jgi:LacI family transcriptional regulator
MRHITIKDIAKNLKVSVSTVSRAFNDKYDIKKETRDLILTTAKAMGYRPNPIAKKLIDCRTYTIGVIIPEFINSFFPEVIMGIQHVFVEKHYQVLIMSSNESNVIELKNIVTMEENRVDGLIISLSCSTTNTDYLNSLIQKGFPIVMFNRIDEKLTVPKVVFDDYKWAFFATEHLIRAGHKKIFHYCGPRHLSFAKNRIQGFKDAMIKHRLPFSNGNIVDVGLLIEEGIAVTEHLIEINNLPDAIFAVNDPTAIGAIKALKKHNYKIPEDIAIVGFTESNVAEIIDPPLTSVVQPTFEIGVKTATLLLALIEGKEEEPNRIIMVGGKLNIRESSFKPAINF